MLSLDFSLGMWDRTEAFLCLPAAALLCMYSTQEEAGEISTSHPQYFCPQS